MNSISIGAIVIGILGIEFGITRNVKNKKISKLELENRKANTDYLYQRYKTEKAQKEVDMQKSASKLGQSVSNLEENSMEKPNGNEESTLLSEDEKSIANVLSVDPFGDG